MLTGRTLLIVLAASALLAASQRPAGAFWTRSQAISCADATTEAERSRHRCWELGAYADPGWPALGLVEAEIPAPRRTGGAPARPGRVLKW